MTVDPARPISLELRRFIAEHIRSVEQLEVLILLADQTTRLWTVSEVLRRIQSSEKSVSDCLEYFRNAGLLTVTSVGAYSFSPSDSSLGALVQALAKTYRERRVSVIECIYKRSTPIQDFADAFRLRKEK